MNKKLLVLCGIGLGFLSGCGPNTRQPTEEGTGTSGSDALAAYADLPVDSIRLAHDQSVYVAYGRRLGNELIVEGDMVFVYPDSTTSNNKRVQALTGIAIQRDLWPTEKDTIIVTYDFHPNATAALKDTIKKGMAMWQKAIPVKFQLRQGAQKSYVEFALTTGASTSHIGCLNKKQSSTLQSFRSSGTAAHEIGHILGLYHENNRADRDSYITVVSVQQNPKCDTINYGLAFRSDSRVRDVGDYNYNSIMHYGTGSCITVKQRPGVTLPNGIPGQRDSLSRGDIITVEYTYRLRDYAHIR